MSKGHWERYILLSHCNNLDILLPIRCEFDQPDLHSLGHPQSRSVITLTKPLADRSNIPAMASQVTDRNVILPPSSAVEPLVMRPRFESCLICHACDPVPLGIIMGE